MGEGVTGFKTWPNEGSTVDDRCDDRYRTIQLYAARIRSFTAELGKAYAYGVPAGRPTELWGLEFQHQAMPIHLQTLPENYVSLLARRSLSCAELMRDLAPDGDAIIDSWQVMHSYLTNYSAAASGHVAIATGKDASVDDIDPSAPSVLRYDLLAQLVDPTSVDRAFEHVLAVEAFCRSASEATFTEIQVALLQGLSAGAGVMDIGSELGLSRRSAHRELRRIWTLLGATTRDQGLIEAAHRNII
jgi:DNA-binding NarL/FixJ family response regulator